MSSNQESTNQLLRESFSTGYLAGASYILKKVKTALSSLAQNEIKIEPELQKALEKIFPIDTDKKANETPNNTERRISMVKDALNKHQLN